MSSGGEFSLSQQPASHSSRFRARVIRSGSADWNKQWQCQPHSLQELRKQIQIDCELALAPIKEQSRQILQRLDCLLKEQTLEVSQPPEAPRCSVQGSDIQELDDLMLEDTVASEQDPILQLYNMIDVDESGDLKKNELMKALRAEESVRNFCKRHAQLTPLLNPRTFKAAFDRVDTDKSNGISLQELRDCIQECDSTATGTKSLPGAVESEFHERDGRRQDGWIPRGSLTSVTSMDEISKLFQMIDIDESGEVSKTEFMRALRVEESVRKFCKKHSTLAGLLQPKTFLQAFELIDTDGSNGISESELRACLTDSKISDMYKPFGIDEVMLDQVKKGAFQDPRDHALLQNSKLDEDIYDVSIYYHKKGLFQAIARSNVFMNFTFAVIVLNAIYLGLDTDLNNADALFDADPFFVICENIFAGFFLLELAVRFMAFKSKWNCLKDGWFKFDAILVALVIFETWIMAVIFKTMGISNGGVTTAPLRLMRLLRLSRLVRIMRSLPEMITIVKGMAVAFRAVGSSLLMIGVLTYVFGIILHMLLKDQASQDEEYGFYFKRLHLCMWTLLMDGTLLLDTRASMEVLVSDPYPSSVSAVVVFFIFILMSALTIMNMLIGVLCEVVSAVAASEKEEADINALKLTILRELKKFDDGDGMIVHEELSELMADANAVSVLENIGIDVEYLSSMQCMIFEDADTEVAVEHILEQMLLCRSDLPCSVKHSVAQMNLINWNMANKFVEHDRRLDQKLNKILKAIGGIRAEQPHRVRQARIKT
eukprot:TRINITY_DN14197_c0_g1_i1.p1 TRINITY_DN14197_c0_g1~~TRINITY_DN14197_c0_g1_i1.p1  ORF type:complete len:770 (-),score=142.26 TRINITY_DN14197_c0_g1_i1:95-2404(-)